MNDLSTDEARAVAAAHTARLYVLTRDAYLSPPAVTRVKLTALAELRRVVTDTGLPEGEPTGMVGVSGVRLMERLRAALRGYYLELDPRTRHLVLVDVLTSTWPPTGSGPAAALSTLVADAGTYLAPEISVAQLQHLARRHRATTRTLGASARHGRRERHVGATLAGPVPAVRDMVAEVFGLCPAAATSASVVLMAGGVLDGGRHGLAGGVILQRLDPGTTGPTGGAGFVGTTVAAADPDALIHQLAVLDAVVHLHRELREAVREMLEALLTDVDAVAATVTDEQEATRLRVSRRALDLQIHRLGGSGRRRWVPQPRPRRNPGLAPAPGILGA